MDWLAGCLSRGATWRQKATKKREEAGWMDGGGQILIPLIRDSYSNVRNPHVVHDAGGICLFTMSLEWFSVIITPTKFAVEGTLEV